MRVLVACEFSGVVRDAFLRHGHYALSCDLLPSEKPGPHHQGDVLELLERDSAWDLMIAHPPCTYLTNSGVRWLWERPTRWADLHAATVFFNRLAKAPIPLIAIENPIPHKYAVAEIGAYTQLVQPWQFGHPETKAVCLWLKGLPRLHPTQIVDGREARVHRMAPGPERQRERSRFFTGIAHAMADQWGRATQSEAA